MGVTLGYRRNGVEYFAASATNAAWNQCGDDNLSEFVICGGNIYTAEETATYCLRARYRNVTSPHIFPVPSVVTYLTSR